MTRNVSRWIHLAATPFLAMLALLLAACISAAKSDNLFEVVARVNDSVITGYDVQQRGKLIRFGAGRNVPNQDRLALDELITDELKIQEAKRRGVEFSQQDLEEAFVAVARNNGISEDQFQAALKSNGVERATFDRKLTADFMWRELMRQRYGRRLQPSDDEVESELEKSKSSTEPVYDVKQIVVPLSARASKAKVRQAFEKAVSVKRRLTGCDKIPALAREFGRPSGDVGRLKADQMPGPVREAVLKLKTGQSTDPLRTQTGVHVIMLCGVGTSQGDDRETVQRRLVQQKATRFSESYVEELKRAAIITQ